MKKKTLTSLLLMMTIVSGLALAGCGADNTQDDTAAEDEIVQEDTSAEDEVTEDVPAEDEVTEDVPAEDETAGEENGDTEDSSADDNASTDDALDLGTATAVDVIDSIYTVVAPEFGVYTDNVDASDAAIFQSFTGLADTSVVSEAAFSESMIGSQAYSLVVVRAADPAATADIAAEMKAGIDPRKWICVEADDLQVVSYEDVVLLIMVSSEYAETITSQSVVDAFAQLCGGEVTVY